MDNDIEHDTYSIICPSCGLETIKTLRWLAKCESYICNCGTKVYVKNIMMTKEIDKLDVEIEKLAKLNDKEPEEI